MSSRALRFGWALMAVFTVALVGACGSDKSGATPVEIERLVEAALRRHDAGPAVTSPGGPSEAHGTTPTQPNTPTVDAFRCLSAAGQVKASSTATMFIDLQNLMRDFVPPQPVIPPELPDRCLTTIAAQNDPMAAQIEQGLESEVRDQRRAARAAAAETRANFLSTVRPIAWTWTRVWVDGQSIELLPAVYGCYYEGEGWRSSRADCGHYNDGSWRIRQQGVVVTQEPELSRRVRLSANVHPEGDLYCVVKQAVIDGDFAKLTCFGPREDEQFRIELPKAVGAPDGALATVGVGDLVRIQNHLVITREFTQRNEAEDGTWVVRDVPVENVSLVEASICCHPQMADAGVTVEAQP